MWQYTFNVMYALQITIADMGPDVVYSQQKRQKASGDGQRSWKFRLWNMELAMMGLR
jgi:hypothetical protein